MNSPREYNRFWLARCVYNQHGKQSVATVTKNTKIAGSMIDDLEAVAGKPRGVSYLTVAALAKYYGVSVDYLCGLSDVPTTDVGAMLQAVFARAEVIRDINAALESLRKLRIYMIGGFDIAERT